MNKMQRRPAVIAAPPSKDVTTSGPVPDSTVIEPSGRVRASSSSKPAAQTRPATMVSRNFGAGEAAVDYEEDSDTMLNQTSSSKRSDSTSMTMHGEALYDGSLSEDELLDICTDVTDIHRRSDDKTSENTKNHSLSHNSLGSSRSASSQDHSKRSLSHTTVSSSPSPFSPQKPAQDADNDTILAELNDLPSDAFDSEDFEDDSFSMSPFANGPQQASRTKPGQSNFRQTTLDGTVLNQPAPVPQFQRTIGVSRKDEPPTHHRLNDDALKTWIYPINIGTVRDYQYNIVNQGLFDNILIALPTGLGKTFIAATVMLNWYRWTADAQIVFVAPTKPLVSQQVEACFNIAGIPKSKTTMLTGNTQPGVRAEEWQTKRVFFMTPQTIMNDLQSGICDPKRIVLLVVDEAHRATGNYAYVKIVEFLQRFNNSFRVLALTATPGSTVESVQDVLNGLRISKVAIRTENSLDIKPYVHQRNIDTHVFEFSSEIELCMELMRNALQPLVDKLTSLNAYWSRDPMSITVYGLRLQRQKWVASTARNGAGPVKWQVSALFDTLTQFATPIELLKYHGIRPFWHKLEILRNEASKGGKWKQQVLNSPDFRKMMNTIRDWMNSADFAGHPKLDYLKSVVLNHFLDVGENTRIIIFVHYRDSAEEIARTLEMHAPMVRPHIFVGQQGTLVSEGMDQKTQLDVIEKFKQGTINTLVATSIGEEGLDIGEVDLIVCYDSSASPIRMLQRMGRTGRKRTGNIVMLLVKGKEEDSWMQAKDNYEKMQQFIASGKCFQYNPSPRIIPSSVQPEPVKQVVDIPVENTQAGLPEPKKRARAPKKPPKKFNMPDGVRTGFVKASHLNGNEAVSKRKRRDPSPEVIDPVSLEEVVLDPTEMRMLDRNYRDVGGDEPQSISLPSLDVFPGLQRELRPTRHVVHGRYTRSVVSMLERMHNVVVPDTIDGRPVMLDPDSIYAKDDITDFVVHQKTDCSRADSKSMSANTLPFKLDAKTDWKRNVSQTPEVDDSEEEKHEDRSPGRAGKAKTGRKRTASSRAAASRKRKSPRVVEDSDE